MEIICIASFDGVGMVSVGRHPNYRRQIVEELGLTDAKGADAPCSAQCGKACRDLEEPLDPAAAAAGTALLTGVPGPRPRTQIELPKPLELHFPRPAICFSTNLELNAVPAPEIASRILYFGFHGPNMHFSFAPEGFS